jgi:argininosuccinate lyase
MWKGRFREETDVRVQEFTQSLDLDWRLTLWDLRGSEAHARMLARTGILTPEEGEAILQGLETLRRELEAGKLAPRVELGGRAHEPGGPAHRAGRVRGSQAAHREEAATI